MSIQPRHYLFHLMKHKARRQGWPVDQDHWNALDQSRFQLGLCPATPGVLGDDMGDAVILQQRQIARQIKGAARYDGPRIWQGQWRLRHIDKAQEVVMLRFGRERRKVLFSDRQKDAGGPIGQRRHRTSHVGHMMPVIVGARSPRRALKNTQRCAGGGTGGDGVLAHLRGEWVGGVNHMADLFAPQIGGQTFGPAKAADAGRQRLRDRAVGAPGVGKDCIHAARRQSAGKGGRFGGAAQQEDARHV